VLTREEGMEIRILHRQGHSIRAIAREMGLSRNTVRRYLAGKQAGSYGPRKPRPSKLTAHVPYILARVESAKPARLTAVALLRELQERGYRGEVSLLQKYLRQIRGPSEPEPLVRFETAPGEQLQFDWAIFRRGRKPLVAFVATLGYSRAGFLRFADNARIETLVGDLLGALEYFGGVPREVLCDNAKTVVLKRHAYGRDLHRFHPKLWDMAHSYGFRLRLCRPYRAKTKGKVERFIRYVRDSFYVPLASRLSMHGVELDAITAQIEAGRWLREVANVRVHGTTGQRPVDLWPEDRAALRPWPGRAAHLQQHRQARYPAVPPQHDLRQYDHLLQGVPT
jgi:transposase